MGSGVRKEILLLRTFLVLTVCACNLVIVLKWSIRCYVYRVCS